MVMAGSPAPNSTCCVFKATQTLLGMISYMTGSGERLPERLSHLPPTFTTAPRRAQVSQVT
jgi:hypothetical protein